MPGRCLLFLCVTWPFANSCYRAVIYLWLSQCEFNIHVVMTSVLGIIMFQTWGLFVYVIYFIRVSFQRQFSLIILYLDNFEGHMDRCRGTLLNALADFKVFRGFCDGYFLVGLPVAIVAMTTHVTWQYLLHEACSEDLPLMKTQNFLQWFVVSEILMAILLFTFAIGGIGVNHLETQLRLNILKLRSAEHPEFWNKIEEALGLATEGSQSILYITLFFSVVGVLASLQFQNQDVTYMSSRYNNTNVTLC